MDVVDQMVFFVLFFFFFFLCCFNIIDIRQVDFSCNVSRVSTAIVFFTQAWQNYRLRDDKMPTSPQSI